MYSGGILRQDHEETSMRDAYHSAGFGTRELKANLEECVNKNVVDTYYGIHTSQQLEGTH